MKNHLMKDVGIRTITQQPIPQPISRLRGPSSTGVEMPSIPSAFSSSAYSQRGDAYGAGAPEEFYAMRALVFLGGCLGGTTFFKGFYVRLKEKGWRETLHAIFTTYITFVGLSAVGICAIIVFDLRSAFTLPDSPFSNGHRAWFSILALTHILYACFHATISYNRIPKQLLAPQQQRRLLLIWRGMMCIAVVRTLAMLPNVIKNGLGEEDDALYWCALITNLIGGLCYMLAECYVLHLTLHLQTFVMKSSLIRVSQLLSYCNIASILGTLIADVVNTYFEYQVYEAFAQLTVTCGYYFYGLLFSLPAHDEVADAPAPGFVPGVSDTLSTSKKTKGSQLETCPIQRSVVLNEAIGLND